MKFSYNNLIILLIMNIEAKSITDIEKSLIICHCQVAFDDPEIGDIDYINKNIISLLEKIIYHNGQQMKVDIDLDIDYNHYKSHSLGHPNSSTEILELIIGKIERLKEYLTEIKSSHLGNNPQTIILSDIILNWLIFNPLQRVVIEKVLNHAILNNGN